MPDAQRLPWKFEGGQLNEQLRVAKALEYIAYYLERIDGNLERIASATSGDQSKALKAAIDGVAAAINRNPR